MTPISRREPVVFHISHVLVDTAKFGCDAREIDDLVQRRVVGRHGHQPEGTFTHPTTD